MATQVVKEFIWKEGRGKQVVCNTMTNHNYLTELSFILTIQPLICNLLQAVTIINLALSTAKHLFFSCLHINITLPS